MCSANSGTLRHEASLTVIRGWRRANHPVASYPEAV